MEIYKDKDGKWRWRIVASNDEVVGASSQGFASKQGAKKNAISVYEALFEVARDESIRLAEKRKAEPAIGKKK